MNRVVYAQYEDETWYIETFDQGMIFGDSYDDLLVKAQEAFGPDVEVQDMESADAARTLGL